jgi:cell pole-organizing protein PopZ
MSKPESAGAKSLEEILASIRKSLAEEDRPAEPKPAAIQPGQLAAKPVLPAASPAADGASLLSGKLAGALSRSAANGSALDDDLATLLVPEPAKSAAPVADESTKPADAGAEPKDPLWFLARKPAPPPESKPNGAHAAAPAAEAEVKLSHPQLLRASLPPLFGAETDHALAARPLPEKAADIAALAEKTEASPPPVETLAAETSEPAAGGDQAAPGGVEAASPVAVMAEAPAAAPPVATASEPVDAAVADEPADDKSSPAPFFATQPALPEDAAPAPDAAVAAKPAGAGVPSPGALERTIAEILEPVIRNWLDSNLPRMVEKVIREEVGKAIAVERGGGPRV